MFLDLTLVALIVLSLIGGWRSGALASVFAAIGVVAGLVVALAIAPFALDVTDSRVLRIAILVLLVVGFVAVGNIAGSAAGAQVRGSVRRRWVRRVDSLFGAAFQALAMSLVLWFISIPLAASVQGPVGDTLRASKVFGTIDQVAPAGISQMPLRMAAMLDQSGLPPLVPPFGPRVAQVDAPDPARVRESMLAEVRPAVVQVLGDSSVCQRRLTGSGFVIDDDYVLTNAHVVAGTNVVALDTVIGVKEAEVVLYDPDVDIAVLHSPQLGIDPLQWSDQELLPNDATVILGYPQSGPFEAAPARVRGRLNISGPDIYAAGRVDREAYAIRGSVRQGNSGGPLVDVDGDVVGMIFGAAMDNAETGYALTASQVRERIGDVRTLRVPADTQACVGG